MEIIVLILKIAAALILLKTAVMKFMGGRMVSTIFANLGMEPWGRYFVGVFELAAVALFFVPGYFWLGALIAGGLMIVIILLHLFKLGINKMFFMALGILLVSGWIFCIDYLAGLTPFPVS